jgi:hypothetical protein
VELQNLNTLSAAPAAWSEERHIASMQQDPQFHVVRGDLEEVVITFDRADDALQHAQVLSGVGEPKIKIRDVFERVHTIPEFDELFVSPWKARK